MKLGTVLLIILIALGVLYYFNFESVNSFAATTLKLSPTVDTSKTLNVNDSGFLSYNDFEHGFSFKYPAGYYVVEQNSSDLLVALMHFGDYGDVEYFAFQQYSQDPKARFSADIPDEIPTQTTIQGRTGFYSQTQSDTAVLRNFYFSCGNNNYMIASRIPVSLTEDSDLYYYFIKTLNCNFK
ncbi:Uncharacterised protein [uncultured archaeon]|nr:Uncharacterised protein [uncultured archaeon]